MLEMTNVSMSGERLGDHVRLIPMLTDQVIRGEM